VVDDLCELHLDLFLKDHKLMANFNRRKRGKPPQRQLDV
jgi:hypothetical protein